MMSSLLLTLTLFIISKTVLGGRSLCPNGEPLGLECEETINCELETLECISGFCCEIIPEDSTTTTTPTTTETPSTNCTLEYISCENDCGFDFWLDSSTTDEPQSQRDDRDRDRDSNRDSNRDTQRGDSNRNGDDSNRDGTGRDSNGRHRLMNHNSQRDNDRDRDSRSNNKDNDRNTCHGQCTSEYNICISLGDTDESRSNHGGRHSSSSSSSDSWDFDEYSSTYEPRRDRTSKGRDSHNGGKHSSSDSWDFDEYSSTYEPRTDRHRHSSSSSRNNGGKGGKGGKGRPWDFDAYSTTDDNNILGDISGQSDTKTNSNNDNSYAGNTTLSYIIIPILLLLAAIGFILAGYFYYKSRNNKLEATQTNTVPDVEKDGLIPPTTNAVPTNITSTSGTEGENQNLV